MATQSRAIAIDLDSTPAGARLAREPYSFDFFQAVRLLEKLCPRRTPVGKFAHPSAEVAHFGAHASLAFPASQIQGLETREDGLVGLLVNFMGLIGPEGTLPNPYTSLVIERLRSGDTSLQDFFDIFNHRIISLFYRAWRKYRFDLGHEMLEGNRFSRHILSLVGLGTEGLQERQCISDDALVYYSGLLAQRPRSAQALRQILMDYFDVPVQVEQFAGGWYHLDEQTQCCLADEASESTELGLGAVVGDAVWNQQAKVRVVLGPLPLERYVEFLPDGSNWNPLQAWLQLFSNNEFDFEIKLVLEREQVPACEVGADEDELAPRLGWTSWLKSVPFARDPDDTVLATSTM